MSSRYYAKICGLTSVEDAGLAIKNGADLLGMVFHPYSRRCCKIEEAAVIKKEFSAKFRVLVFAHDPTSYILDIYKELRDMSTFLQVPAEHEGFRELCRTLSPGKIIPSLSIKDTLAEADVGYLSSHPLLILDTPGGKGKDGQPVAGGTGQTFPWERVAQIDRPYLLAGGLTADNICAALKTLDPLGVDVSSGIESSPGRKDVDKMKEFLYKVKEYPQACND